MKQYDVNYFIKKFEAIPEENWITDEFGINGVHCAFGHCGQTSVGDPMNDESAGLYKLGNKFNLAIENVNDGLLPKYNQSSPKQRVLAMLYDIKAEEAVKDANNIINTKVQEYAEV